ncbi:MAG: rslA 2, partial [Amnibacterium sp.]|nr:rslA 2 [Amnibacterium sp.]
VGAVPAGPAAAATRLAPVHGSAVSAQLTATGVAWGTKLTWSCTYPTGGVDAYAASSYRLVVTTTAGRTAVVATWGVHGERASGLAAATSIPRSAIRSVDIRTDTGTVLARADLAG